MHSSGLLFVLHFSVDYIIGASLSEPQDCYVRQVHKNLLNKNGLPYTATELYAPPVRESVLKEYGLPHTVRREH